jgi:hypothetical protein
MARLAPYFPKSHGKSRVDDRRMMEGPAVESAAPKTVMIDATYLKAHRTASSLRLKKGGLDGPPDATATTAEEPKGMIMADDTDTMNDVEAPAQEEAPVAVKKQRKPRAKKISVVATTAEGTGGTDGPKKRGRKPRVSKDPTPVEPAAPKLAPTPDRIADDAATSAGDEMADLLQLEADNQELRKMLAEKLRAENADLRKKLNFG